jgi:hypothetical protein
MRLQAGLDGDPSTVPLIAVIKHKFPQYQWVPPLVSAFITISICISCVASVGGGGCVAWTALRTCPRAGSLLPRFPSPNALPPTTSPLAPC